MTSELQNRRLMLCNNCGRYYWVLPTGNRYEWRVALATRETVRQIVQADPTIEDVFRAVMEGVLETSWYIAEFFPTQMQASVDPLCHTAECAISGKLVETIIVMP